jgi:hypothetical protein
MRTSGEHRNQPLDRNGQRASAPNRFFFGIAQRKSLAKRKASCRGTIFFPLTGNIDETPDRKRTRSIGVSMDFVFRFDHSFWKSKKHISQKNIVPTSRVAKNSVWVDNGIVG